MELIQQQEAAAASLMPLDGVGHIDSHSTPSMTLIELKLRLDINGNAIRFRHLHC